MRERSLLMMAMLGLSGCGDWTTTAITLSNRSGQPVSGVSADFAGKVSSVGKIVPGQSVILASHAGGEGLLCLRYRQGGEELHYAIDYMTQGMPTHYRVAINDRTVSSLSSQRSDYSDGKPRLHRPLAPGEECPG